MADHQVPSMKKSFLVTSAAFAVISILNKQQFITETREFVFASLYYGYVWYYEYLKEGRRLKLNNLWRRPNFYELVCLLVNVFWVFMSGYWIYGSIWNADLKFDYMRRIVVSIYGLYNAYMHIKHSRGGWRSVWDLIDKITHPHRTILRQFDDEALETAAAAGRAMTV